MDGLLPPIAAPVAGVAGTSVVVGPGTAAAAAATTWLSGLCLDTLSGPDWGQHRQQLD